jgi:hypothetical protein
MEQHPLIDASIRIKNLNGASTEFFSISVGDVLKVKEIIEEKPSVFTFTFYDKFYSWVGHKEHYEVVHYRKEYYKDKYIQFVNKVGYDFITGTAYHIKECRHIDAGIAVFIFYDAPDPTWTTTGFSVSNKYYTLVDSPVKEKEIDLLAEAKRRYPVGTRYTSVDFSKLEYIVEKQDFTLHKPDVIWGENAKGVLYDKGKWAEIIKNDKEAILEQAIRNYPIGTKYKPLDYNGLINASYEPQITTHTPYWRNSCIDAGIGYIYAEGVWAEIVKQETEFGSSDNPLDVETLLAEVARRYPKGTKYIPTRRSERYTDTSSGTFLYNTGSKRVEDKVLGTGIYEVTNNKWAEIVVDQPEKKVENPSPSYDEEAQKTWSWNIPSQASSDKGPESKITAVNDLNVTLRKASKNKFIKQVL